MPQVYKNDLPDRFSRFSTSVLVFCGQLRLPPDFSSIKKQLVKSATSIGANYLESQAAISKADFRNKVYISKKEARETLYWLELLKSSKLARSDQLTELIAECDQIIRILQTITSKVAV